MKRALACLLLALTLPAASAQDLSGAWTVSGTDPQLGAFTGTVNVRPAVQGVHEVTRLVALATPLPDGRTLALSWRGEGRVTQGRLRVDVALRRREFFQAMNGVARGPLDAVPLALGVDLVPATPLGPGAAPIGTRVSGGWTPGGPTETWTRVAGASPDHPVLERRLDPCPVTVPRRLMFLLFRDYHRLPDVAPYAGLPGFQTAVHFQMVDTTARTYTRAHPDHVVVVQKTVDALSIAEERLRADALRWALVAKATRWDREMLTTHVEPSTGMLGGQIPGGARHVHGDSALHQGVWVASQMYRFEATGDLEARRNVELGTKALIMMVDAPGDPKEFGRAVGDASWAPANWTRSTALPGIAFIPGGNNDMCHGIDYGFASAERALPVGHPLLAQLGARAKQLVENSKVAQKGKHGLVLGGIAARLTGDPAVQRKYRRESTWSPLEMLWLAFGEGIGLTQEINGRSGPHLSCTTIQKVRMLGASSPNLVERLWRRVAERGARVAFEQTRTNRPGNLAAIAASLGVPGAADLARSVLSELPCPRPTGSATMNWRNDPSFVMSPYPALPWKFDFMTNTGRQQPMVAYPAWWIGDSDNYWKEGPYGGGTWFNGQGPIVWSSQDYLHAYWVARHGQAFSATD